MRADLCYTIENPVMAVKRRGAYLSNGNKATRKKLWRLLPAVLLMALIFHFSAEDATASAQSSGNTMLWLLRLFRVSDTNAIVENSELYSLLDFCIRKGAHFSLYTALGFLLSFAWTVPPSLPQWKRATYAVLCGIFYAASDELHQYFVPGRACQVRDVCIDTAGVLLGCAIFALLYWLVARHRQKKNGAQL